jgi:O-antigen/teichoic acid export membrane protein
MLSAGSSTPPGAPGTEQLGTLSGAAVVRGGLWRMVSRTVPQLQLLALSVVAARYLGPDGMGRQSFIAFVGLSFVLVATAGLPVSLSRFTGELLGAGRGGSALTLYALTRRVELAAAALTVVALVAIAALGGDPAGAWLLAGIGSALAVLQTVPAALLGGAARWRDATIAGVVTGVVSVPATIAVLAAGGGITGFFAVEAGVIAANLAWTTALARRLVRRFPPPEPVPAEVRARFSAFVWAATALALVQFVVWRRSELFVLDRVSDDAQIALYSIAFAAVAGLARVVDAITSVTMPAVATLLGAGEWDRIRGGFWRALRILAFLTPPVAALALATGPALVRLVYGEAFAGAGDVLLILLAPLVLLPLLTTAGALLFALGRLRFVLAVGLAATVLNLGLALVLIPAYDAVGAAISNAVSQTAAGVPALVLAARLLAPVDVAWGRVGRSLLLAALAGLAAYGVLRTLGDGPGGALAAVLAGALSFLAVGPLLRPLDGDDAAWLARVLPLGRFPRAATALRAFGGTPSSD